LRKSQIFVAFFFVLFLYDDAYDDAYFDCGGPYVIGARPSSWTLQDSRPQLHSTGVIQRFAALKI
jgi:hypothetical protein